jgi:hypothetical protein
VVKAVLSLTARGWCKRAWQSPPFAPTNNYCSCCCHADQHLAIEAWPAPQTTQESTCCSCIKRGWTGLLIAHKLQVLCLLMCLSAELQAACTGSCKQANGTVVGSLKQWKLTG